MKRFNIYHRKDGRWEGRLSKCKCSNGRRKFRYFFGHTKDEVCNKIKEYQQSKASALQCSKTVSQIFDEWYRSIQHRIKESTAANYLMKAQKHIIPKFGDKSVSSLVSDDFYDFMKAKKDEGLSNRYVSDIIILMKSLFKYAVKTYHILNTMDEITLPKKKLPEIQLLDEEQQQKLQQYIAENPNPSTVGVALSMSTGIRIGELCALRWEDIDMEKRILTVKKTIQRIQNPANEAKTKLLITEPKSESSMRTIPIPECVAGLLKKFIGNSNEYLLSGKKKPIEPRTMQYRFAKILENVKLPSVHFHSLRHMFASNCIKLGFDVKALSEILGHSKVEITLNRYVHSSFEQKADYMSRLKLAV